MKYLYNIGCSFSTGNGIPEQFGIAEDDAEGRERVEKENRYSKFLAENLRLVEINEAIGGGSNQRIFRMTWDWISENLSKINETIFVIQWSYPVRYERLLHHPSHKNVHGRWRPAQYDVDLLDSWKTFSSDNDKSEENWEHSLIWDNIHFTAEMSDINIRYMLSLQSFFKENNCKYIFFEGDTNFPETFCSVNTKLRKMLDKDYFINKGFLDFAGEELVLNGHPNQKMQILWAEKLEKFIRDKGWLNDKF